MYKHVVKYGVLLFVAAIGMLSTVSSASAQLDVEQCQSCVELCTEVEFRCLTINCPSAPSASQSRCEINCQRSFVECSSTCFGAICQNQTAGISGIWDSLSQKCTVGGDGERCRLTGKFLFGNSGGGATGSSEVRFFLSNDQMLDTGDILLRETTIDSIKPGKFRKLKFRSTVQGSASGKFIIAVLDANNDIIEVNEDDNIVVSPAIP